MRKLTVILCILMLLCAIVPPASATSDSLKVIVTVEKGNYQPGNQITIRVHVFDNGFHVTADEITVNVGYYPSEENVNVTETEKGIYEGTYTVKPEDTMVSITAMVYRGTDSDTGYTSIDLEEENEVVVDFSVDITMDDPNDYQAEPGDAVEFTVTVKENGTLVEPDTFQLSIDGNSQSYTNVGTGTYKSTYNIPSALNNGDRYDIDAFAEKDDMEDWDSDSFYVLFFMVCYNEITKTDTASTFDIYVSDMNGKVVVGASVSISYDHDDHSGTPDITQQGTTDSQGKAGFTITYEDISYVDVEGTVSHGGKSQGFDGTIWISLGGGIITQDPRDEGFDVIDDSELKVYKPGDTVSRVYTAYMDGVPWAIKDVYYIITEGFSPTYEVIKQASVTVDSNGRFSVTFTAPDEMVIIIFTAGRPKTAEDFLYDEDDDLVYEDDMEYIITTSGADLPMLDWDNSVSVSVNKLRVGEPTTVRVDGSNVPAGARVIAAWFVGSADDYLEMVTSAAFSFKWQCWTGMSGTALTKSGGKYTGEILLPEYMPQGEDYTIVAGWITDDGETHLNHVVLQPGESGGSTSGDDDGFDSDTFILIGVLVIILIILLVVIKVATKPKKKGPM